MSYIKSPLNYTGGKFKLLPQLIPLFPTDIDMFVDLFGGGGNVLVNVKANSYVYNDLDANVSSIIGWMRHHGSGPALDEIDAIINTYELSKTNAEGYLRLRADYNEAVYKLPQMLYTLICYSFNNQIRFNSKGEYNMPFGKDRSSFNPSLREKFIKFVDRLREIEKQESLGILSHDFYELPINPSCFVYCDPPYLISTATYNEKDGWNEDTEKRLLNYLRELDDRKIRFALSNVLEHGGKTNELLTEFAKDFTLHDLAMNYSNASYQKKDKVSLSREVLITNY